MKHEQRKLGRQLLPPQRSIEFSRLVKGNMTLSMKGTLVLWPKPSSDDTFFRNVINGKTQTLQLLEVNVLFMLSLAEVIWSQKVIHLGSFPCQTPPISQLSIPKSPKILKPKLRAEILGQWRVSHFLALEMPSFSYLQQRSISRSPKPGLQILNLPYQDVTWQPFLGLSQTPRRPGNVSTAFFILR